MSIRNLQLIPCDQVALKREWAREPDLPAIPQIEKNVDPVLARPPTEDQAVRLRFVDQLIGYSTKKGQIIGSHFRWLPCRPHSFSRTDGAADSFLT